MKPVERWLPLPNIVDQVLSRLLCLLTVDQLEGQWPSLTDLGIALDPAVLRDVGAVERHLDSVEQVTIFGCVIDLPRTSAVGASSRVLCANEAVKKTSLGRSAVMVFSRSRRTGQRWAYRSIGRFPWSSCQGGDLETRELDVLEATERKRRRPGFVPLERIWFHPAPGRPRRTMLSRPRHARTGFASWSAAPWWRKPWDSSRGDWRCGLDIWSVLISTKTTWESAWGPTA